MSPTSQHVFRVEILTRLLREGVCRLHFPRGFREGGGFLIASCDLSPETRNVRRTIGRYHLTESGVNGWASANDESLVIFFFSTSRHLNH